MKSFLPLPLALLAAGLLLPAAGRAQQPASSAPVDSAAVLAVLKDVRARQQAAMRNARAQVLANINAAAADNTSAGKAYEQAVMAVEFQGQGADGSKIAEWRKRNADMLRNHDFLVAARLQLVYLSLTWQRSAGAKAADLLPALYEYVAQVESVREEIEPFANQLKRSLSDSVFTAYYQVGPYISVVQNWEMGQFNTEGIFQKTILPELRRLKDRRVLDYWDKCLQTETARAERAQNSLASNRFNRIRKPALLWNRAEDVLLLGDKPRAVNEMLALVKTYSDHPDFDKWAARLEAVVSEVPPASPTPAAGGADGQR